ncbi:hypothetical protein OAL35_01930 [bacterium]|nr:hypothetical protein [Rhodopirellula sp.]MDC0295593.1 hypothetical protein [bacterium]
MNQPRNPAKPASMKKHVRTLLILSGAIIVVALAYTYFNIKAASDRVEFERQIIMEPEENVAFDDSQSLTRSEDQNAFTYISKLADKIDQFDQDILQVDYPKTGYRLTKSQIEKLGEAVDSHSDFFSSMEQASRCSHFQSDFNPADGFSATVPHLRHLQSLWRGMSRKAVIEAYRGNADEGLRLCGVILQLTKLTGNEPLLISQLTSVAGQRAAIATAHHVFQIAKASPEACSRFDKLLSEIDVFHSLENAIKGERSMGIIHFQQLRDGTLDSTTYSESISPPSLGRNWLTEAYLNDDEAAYLRSIRLQLEVLQETKRIRDAATQSVFDEITQSDTRFIITKLILPSLSAAADAADQLEAESRCLRILMQMQSTGEDAIENLSLADDITNDPFTGADLKISQTPEGLVIYSVGQNLTDDGGSVLPTESARPLDVGFGPLKDPASDDAPPEQPAQ